MEHSVLAGMSLTCVCVCVCFPGPESRERPGVLRAQRQALQTAPSACEQTTNPPSSPSIFFFLSCIPPSIPPTPYCLPLSHPQPSSIGEKETLPRQTEDRIGVHHGSSDRLLGRVRSPGSAHSTDPPPQFYWEAITLTSWHSLHSSWV